MREVFLSATEYNRLVALLRSKKNIILQGAPGVGKTYAAKRLAYSMMGAVDESRVKMVQFHQNYSYEDFIMGYRPTEEGFELRNGIFHQFCTAAAEQPDRDFFFIIDEINRGNMSKIFGELLMLIESDYRGMPLALAYDARPFSVPKNIFIIGMMNTADRSLAMIDYALRRRFSFYEMCPAFTSEGFKQYQDTLHSDTFDRLIRKVIDLNDEITADKSLGKGFAIGHSYFCKMTAEKCTDAAIASIIDYDIMPMLEEYWFDDDAKVAVWRDNLHSTFG